MASIKLKGDTSGELTIQAPSVAGTNTLDLPASSGTLLTTTGNGSQLTGLPNSYAGTKNLIINGNMAIDQRNAGVSNSATANVYTTDRWQLQMFGTTEVTYQQVIDAPAGFNKSLKITSNATPDTLTGSDSVSPRQRIEGYNIAHLGWGTANAQTVTLSFWVKASITGTYPVSFHNWDFTRSFVSEYNVVSANTWEKKTITITGPTIGTWLSDNSTGIIALFNLDNGSDSVTATTDSWISGNYRRTSSCVSFMNNSSATWQITGVQLEAGTTATDFENLQYGTQLDLCQRYCYVLGGETSFQWLSTGPSQATNFMTGFVFPPVTMRAGPTLSFGTLSHYRAWHANSWGTAVGISLNQSASGSIGVDVQKSGLTGMCALGMNNSTASKLIFSAEL
jgi:hypothetical protein